MGLIWDSKASVGAYLIDLAAPVSIQLAFMHDGVECGAPSF